MASIQLKEEAEEEISFFQNDTGEKTLMDFGLNFMRPE